MSRTQTSTRPTPQATGSEAALLGLLMWRPDLLDAARDLVRVEHFAGGDGSRHGRLYAWMQRRAVEGRGWSPNDLADWAASDPKAVEACGGLAYITSLPEQTMPGETIEDLAAEIQEARLRREVLGELRRLEGVALDGTVEDLDAELGALRERVQTRAQVEEVGAVVARTSVDLERLFQEPRFISSGIHAIDTNADYGGLSREGVTLILGASGMGKTSLINRLALGMAATGTPVYLHGTETSTERRMSDMLTSWAGTSIRAIDRERHAAGKGDWAARRELDRLRDMLDDAEDVVSRLPLVLTGAGLTVDEVCARARTLHRQGRCAALVVDYLQDLKHVHGQGLRVGERTAQVGYASTRLKDLAAELRIPVIVGAQVSGEKDGPSADPRPQLWDVQWSSSAHQDAEEVYALFRGDYYTDRGIKLKDPGYPGKLEVIPRKRRVGILRPLLLDFDGPSRWVAERLLVRVR